MATNCKRCGTEIRFFSTIEVANQKYCVDCSKEVEAQLKNEEEERKRVDPALIEQVLCVTTQNLHGYEVVEHLDVVHAQVILGVNAWKDMMGSFKSWAGGRAKALEAELRSGFKIADTELKREAYLIGANAILAAEFDGGMEVAGDDGSNDKMMVISASGTAVRVVAVDPKVDAVLAEKNLHHSQKEYLQPLVDTPHAKVAKKSQKPESSDLNVTPGCYESSGPFKFRILPDKSVTVFSRPSGDLDVYERFEDLAEFFDANLTNGARPETVRKID